MSRLDEPVDRGHVVQSARMTVDAHKPRRRCRICTDEGCEHEPRRRCQCCTDDGCEQLAWARQSLAVHRAKRTQTTPTIDRPHATAGVARRTA